MKSPEEAAGGKPQAGRAVPSLPGYANKQLQHPVWGTEPFRPAARGQPLWHSTKPITAPPTSSQPCRAPPTCCGCPAGHLRFRPPPSLPTSSHGLWTEALTVCTLGLPHRAWRGAGHTAAPGRSDSTPPAPTLPQPRLLPTPSPDARVQGPQRLTGYGNMDCDAAGG